MRQALDTKVPCRGQIDNKALKVQLRSTIGVVRSLPTEISCGTVRTPRPAEMKPAWVDQDLIGPAEPSRALQGAQGGHQGPVRAQQLASKYIASVIKELILRKQMRMFSHNVLYFLGGNNNRLRAAIQQTDG